MLLNRKRQLWFCTDPACEQPQWLLLSAGISERKTSRSSENLLFFELGNEQSPEVKMTDSVKVITLRGHIDETDDALMKLLEMHGKTVGVLQRDLSKNSDNEAIFCEVSVEVADDGSGAANEPQTFEIRLHCGTEINGKITTGVNGFTFTVI